MFISLMKMDGFSNIVVVVVFTFVICVGRCFDEERGKDLLMLLLLLFMYFLFSFFDD